MGSIAGDSFSNQANATCMGSAWRAFAILANTLPSTLSRDNKILGIGRQGFRDQLFANVRTIRISGVYEVDPQLNGSAKHGYRPGTILRRSPDSLARQAHGSESKTVDG